LKSEFLELIRCAYCGGELSFSKIIEADKGEVSYGLVRCACSEFPVLGGILNLKFTLLNNYYLVRLLNEGKPNQAIALALLNEADRYCRILAFMESKGLLGRALAKTLTTLLMIKARRVYGKYSDDEVSFCDLLDSTSPQDRFTTFLKHRFSAEALWTLYPFLPLLKENNKRILDLACGAGHASFVISACVRPDHLVCADEAFSSLYLAKKYMAPESEFVCLDANYPLPFKDGIFTSVLMMEAIEYIVARSSLAREMERILTPQKLLLMLHMPNSPTYDEYAGYRLTPRSRAPPSAWIDFFQHNIPKLAVKTLPNRELLADFISKNQLNLSGEYSDSELSSSDNLAIVGTSDSSLFRLYKEVANIFLSSKSNLVINPIYKTQSKTNGLALRFRKELSKWPEVKHMPKEFFIDDLKDVIKRGSLDVASNKISRQEWSYIDDLMRSFIVINVPKRYC
jgi:ubiquinone/menaquinone biosynthesis C-methylase UbiE